MVYIGSTCQPLAQRLTNHRSDYRNWLKNKKTKNGLSSFKIIANGDYDIVLIEYYPCSSKEELFRRERYFLQETKCVNQRLECVTSIGTGQTKEERMKEYRQVQKVKINDTYKVYISEHKEMKAGMDKKYRELHLEQIKQHDRERYLKNRESILKRVKIYRLQRHKCECGVEISLAKKSAHSQTKGHLKYITSQ